MSLTIPTINSTDGDGNTVLHFVAAMKNHQAIELLLSCNDEAPGVLKVKASVGFKKIAMIIVVTK